MIVYIRIVVIADRESLRRGVPFVKEDSYLKERLTETMTCSLERIAVLERMRSRKRYLLQTISKSCISH